MAFFFEIIIADSMSLCYSKYFIVLFAALEPVRTAVCDTKPNHWCGGSYLRADRIISVKRRAVHFDY
ncbi:MAG: hypothetical protein K2M94_01090, partial [Paramuribaculum sp.]|nr:hypothetical protein [Paramuribaculum sp.]